MVSLAINISNCQNNCVGCHSSYLRKDIGEELTDNVLKQLIQKNKGVDCVLFMGEGNDTLGLLKLAKVVKNEGLLVGLYSGRDNIEKEIYNCFDYVKIGSYIKECGPIDKETTNQRLFNKSKNGTFINITHKFWKN